MSKQDETAPTATGTVDFVGHVVLGDAQLVSPSNAANVIMTAATDRGRWVARFTSQIGDVRAQFRSTYFHWAMAINGLHVAAERYASKEWQATATGHRNFTITALRPANPRTLLAQWPGDEAADAHLATVPKLAAWGYIELYSVLESAVFDFYRSYWNLNPTRLIRGPEFRELRRLKKAAEAADANDKAVNAWREAWSARLNKWHRKKLYDGLHRVFRSFCSTTGLKTPTKYKDTTIDTWVETIEGLGIVRNLLVHGEQLVPDELEAFCKTPHSMSFDFRAGEPLRVELFHLQAFELFSEQFLNGLNFSGAEHPDAGA